MDENTYLRATHKLQFKPEIDLFASRMNYQISKYVSWRPEPETYAVDAFSISWKNQKNLLFSSFQYHSSSSSKNAYRQSNRHSGGTKLANAAVLRDTNEDVSRLSDIHKEKTFTSNTTRKNICTQNMGQTGLVSVPLIRRSVEDHQLPQNVTNIIMSSWRKGTTKQYKCYLNKWEIFCSRRNINSIHTSVNNVLIFLTELYETGVGYSAINTAKSALSNVVTLAGMDNVQLGNHALVKRFMKEYSIVDLLCRNILRCGMFLLCFST